MKSVQEQLIQFCGKEKLIVAPKPQMQTAIGAARVARWWASQEPVPFNFQLRSPHTIGIKYFPQGRREPGAFFKLIDRNARIPMHTHEIGFKVGGKGTSFYAEITEERMSRVKEECVYTRVRPVEMKDLPPKQAESEEVKFTLDYPDIHQATVTVNFRGRVVKIQLNGVS